MNTSMASIASSTGVDPLAEVGRGLAAAVAGAVIRRRLDVENVP
ncbi:hypothetical protein [Streptomyces sp. NPDC001404]